LVDKPGRRKKNKRPWGKIGAVVVVALLVAAAGYYVYENYIYKAPLIYARIETSDGSFVVELFPACAPETVTNFVNLANSGYYNDLVWHRIAKSPAVIQTGDNYTRGGLNSTRANWGSGGTAATVPLEWCGWLHNYQGYLAMAHTQASNSSGSQFYINLNNASYPYLDGKYTVFGKVISGWSVVEAISKSPLCTATSCPAGWADVTEQPYPAVFVNGIVILGTSTEGISSASSSTSG
jgi:cyclophilin family peptidyl-prolyl cis-trans isomerase